MAILQRTLVSGSIWIGSGSGTTWDGYNSPHNYPFAIYQNDHPLLYYNINQNSSGGSLVIPTTTSINSNIYSSGFKGEGFKIFANPKTIDDDIRLFWTGQFDDLWVRGSMHVKEFVIDKIRATNGSLWVSDAGQAESASFVQSGDNNGINYSGTMSLYFAADTTMPFILGDIIRSKQWINDASTITANWDFLGGVSQIGTITYDAAGLQAPSGLLDTDIAYNTVSITMSRTGVLNSFDYTNHYYAGNDPESTIQDFINTISVLKTDWVRAGNLNQNSDRQGYIYLTSNDLGGPFIDVANNVDTIVGALGGTDLSALNGGFAETQSVSQSNIKMRIGNLAGIYDQAFNGHLSGYGMWADNAYLRGWIVANQGGNIAGWKIEPNTLSNLSMKLVANTNTSYIGLGTDTYSGNGIWIGTSSAGSQFSVGGPSQYIRWDGSGFTVSTPNFRIQTGSVSMSGIVSANSGIIGGWTINQDNISSSGIKLAPGTEPFIGIGTTTYGAANVGIWVGKTDSAYKARFYKDSNNYLDWDGSRLQIKAANFQLDQNGIISASGATFSGKVTAASGEIGGWNIGDTSLYSPGITLSSGTIKSIGLNATTYGGTGIYMGTSSAGVSFSVVGSNGSIQFATNSLAISTSNFSAINGNVTAINAVISGSISSSAGQIGGWSIEDQWLQNSSSNALIRLSTTSSYWDLINSQGVFNYAPDSHPQMYSLFTCSYNGVNSQANQWGTTSIATGSFIQQEGGKPRQVYIQYTASYGNNRELLFYINTNSSAQIIVPPKQTIFYSLEISKLEASTIGGLGKMTPIELYSVMYTASGYEAGSKQNSEYFIGMAGENASFRIVSSYTNPSQTQTKLMSLGIYSRVKADTGYNYKVAFTMSNVFVNSVKSVTQLSDKGLFLFGGPNKFLKIASDPTVPGSTQQYAVASLDIVNAGKLYVGGEQIRLGESGSIGGGIGGDGTTGYIPMFQDDTTIEDSPVYYDEDTIISSKPISAPEFTGSGFVFEDVTSTYNAKVGNLPVGYNADNKSIKQILNDMLFFAAPTLTLTTNLTKTMQASDTEETTLTDIGATKQAPFKISSGARLATTFSCGANYSSVGSLKMETKSSDLGGTNLNTTITPNTSTYYYYYDLGVKKQFTDADSEIAYAKISGTDTLGGTLTSVTDTLTLYVGLRFVLAYTDGTNWWFKSISGTGTSAAPFTASLANYLTFQQAFSNSVVTTTAPSRLKNTYNDGSTQYCFNANLWTNMSAGQTCLLMVATRNDHPATTIQWWNGAVWVGQPSVNSNGVTTTTNSTALVGATTYTWPQGTASTATGGYTYSLAFANGLARNEKCWVINAKDSAVSGTQKYRFN